MQKLGPIQEKWIKALRSGEYDQCKGTLRDEGGRYCCLGVLYHVVRGTEPPVGINVLDDYMIGATGVKSPTAACNTTVLSLAVLNDSGKSFIEIADFIEAYPERVFSKEA